MQKVISKLTVALLLASFLLPAGQSAFGQESEEIQQYVLLSNGRVIRGFVSRESDNIVLQIPNGSRLVFSPDTVSSLCDDLVDAYWQKAARTKASDLEGQKDLFQWCLANGLLKQAQNQIDIISAMEIKPSELEYIHRQLTVAFDMRAQQEKLEIQKQDQEATELPFESIVGETDTKQIGSVRETKPIAVIVPRTLAEVDHGDIRELPSLTNAVDENHLPADDKELASTVEAETGQPEIKLVGFSESVKESDSPSVEIEAPPTQTPEPASIEELDALVKSLPKPSVAMYKRKVEPLLVRSCYNAGCHQSKATVMPLTRLAKGQLIPRRLSQRNLHSIINFANPNEPLQSRLLASAMKAHGGLEAPVIKPGTVQFNNLANWLIAISNQPNAYHEMPTAKEAIRSLPDLDSPVGSETAPSLRVPKTVNEGAELDRHDPNLFNNRFLENDDEQN